MSFRKQGSLFVPTRNILIPHNWTLRDNRGFISPGVIGGIAGARRRTAATTEYWGVTDPSAFTSFDYWNGYTLHNVDGVWTYTCPGTGTRAVQSIELWCKSSGGTPGAVRLAVYDTGLNLIGEGNSTSSVSSTTVGWFGHVNTADLKPAGGSGGQAVNLTGGTNYVFAYSTTSSDVRIAYVASAGAKYVAADYSTGYPSTLGAGSNISQKMAFKIGVL